MMTAMRVAYGTLVMHPAHAPLPPEPILQIFLHNLWVLNEGFNEKVSKRITFVLKQKLVFQSAVLLS